MKKTSIIARCLKIGLWTLLFCLSGLALNAQEIPLQPEEQDLAPLRSDVYPNAQALTSKYPDYDPQTGYYYNQWPYYDRSTGYFIYGPKERQDPNWPVQESVTNQYPYYDRSTGVFVYGPIVNENPNIPIPDPDAMPPHIDTAKPNTDGWAADAPKPNIGNPNIAKPRLPTPNISKTNIDLIGR